MPKQRLPGSYRRDFKAKVIDVTNVERKGDDGRPLREWHEPGAFEQETVYHGVLTRLDGRFRLLVEWVDLQGTGHRFAVPHEVVSAIKSATDRILADARSDRSTHAAQTRRDRKETR